MRPLDSAIGLGVFGIAMLYMGAVNAVTSPVAPDNLAGSGVKLDFPAGHGSGTYLGNGLILTAGHVARAATDGKITVKSDDQKERPATVLWTNEAYDLALVRLDDPIANIRVAKLACRTPVTAEPIYVDGNPIDQEFLRTWGRVSGSARWTRVWKDAVMTDVAIIPGMSGGGVFDTDGDVIGVAVGVMISPAGYGGQSVTNVSYVVPASDACMLMGRF